MALDASAVSAEAKALSDDVAQRIHDVLQTEIRPRPGVKFRKATAAFLCDLIRAVERDPERLSYRSMRSNTFTGGGYSFDLVGLKIVPGLTRLGLIDRIDGNDAGESHAAAAARFRARSALAVLWEQYGVTPDRWREHFQAPVPTPEVIDEPLILRTFSQRRGGIKDEGVQVAIDPADRLAASLRDRMVRINAFMLGRKIEPVGHRAFRRSFRGDGRTSYMWNKGGRIASIGDDTYQRAKPEARAAMTIDGERVVEIDIAACHLTILHGLRGFAFDCEADPYEGIGIPRPIVKDWVVMTLGHSGFHAGWPSAKSAKLKDQSGGSLAKRFPIRATREAILSRLPVLSDWPEIDIGWADLQYVESCVMMETMETLAFKHGVVCLPVHDSIIVPASKERLAREVLTQAFERNVGVTPRLSPGRSVA